MIHTLGTAMIPLVFAALGGLLSERAGVLNIALEGCMGAGAFATALIMMLGGGPWWAALGGISIGAVLGLLLSGVHLGLGANLFIGGLGINLLSPALSGLISQVTWGHKGILRLDSGSFAPLSLFHLPLSLWLLPLVTSFVAFLLFRHSLGPQIRSAGESPSFLIERGISATKIRCLVLLISSASAALGGSFLVFQVGAFVPGMSAGRGWTSLVIIWLGFRRPWGILLAAFFFALVDYFASQAQGFFAISASLLLALPYLAALLALVLIKISRTQ